MAGARPVVICDLDGTLLGVNSFPYWARCLMAARFSGLSPAGRARLAGAVAVALVARRTGRLDHEALKRRLQSHWAQATRRDPEAASRFARQLALHVRPSLAPLLLRIDRGVQDAVLATAAAADYAVPLGRLLGFRHVLATPPGRDTATGSNVGAAKRDCVLAFLAAQGWQERPRLLLTDHEEDLPLIRVATRTLWFGTQSGLAAVRLAAPDARIEPCGAVLPDLAALGLGAAPFRTVA